MPEYPNGTPSWVDLGTPDPQAAAKFYGELFGWETSEAGSEETGFYTMFTQGGKAVAGLMKSDQGPFWTSYVSVDSTDATLDKVKAAGGTVQMDAMDVTTAGRMAIFTDPSGAALGLWEANEFAGAEVTNEPNSLCWNDVATRDEAACLKFYPAVFDWKPTTPGFAPNGGYTVWERADGSQIGGMMAITDEQFPPEVPSHWAISFAVADTDAIVAKVTELGGTVTLPAMDCPIGRFAGFTDPQGAPFAVMQLAFDPPQG
jgi:predicted enzyme related to lactoylglutathione lyase